ncbi:hypothetical protein HU200_066358 [Digitaria exilis]|uniref:Pentatricopeptide repeat-containing protein n=1 Tax=Digitaria exilis TaxID=1010633 RepID=A0A835A0D7_9POAL|nr:hypothetical protein HU200_066358 [Digitaria exilis]
MPPRISRPGLAVPGRGEVGVSSAAGRYGGGGRLTRPQEKRRPPPLQEKRRSFGFHPNSRNGSGTGRQGVPGDRRRQGRLAAPPRRRRSGTGRRESSWGPPPAGTGGRPAPPQEKRHWKAGKFPGTSAAASDSKAFEESIKNVKKRLDARADAKAWACTVTEALADRHQLQELERGGSRSGQAAHAHQLFEEMQQQGCQPTPELYTALIGAYCRSGLLDEALQLLTDMKASPLCQPDVYTYSTIIKACVDATRFDLVDAMYEDMAERLISPNTVTQNIVLSGYGKAGRLDDMERVLSDMLESTTCKPDVWTMNIILSLFGNRGQVEAMEKWYEKFRSYGIEPETRTLNILIGAYGKEADMRSEGMKPDTKTFCCLIDGFSKAGLFHKVVWHG